MLFNIPDNIPDIKINIFGQMNLILIQKITSDETTSTCLTKEKFKDNIDVLAQNCHIFITNALEIPLYCIRTSILSWHQNLLAPYYKLLLNFESDSGIQLLLQSTIIHKSFVHKNAFYISVISLRCYSMEQCVNPFVCWTELCLKKWKYTFAFYLIPWDWYFVGCWNFLSVFLT